MKAHQAAWVLLGGTWYRDSVQHSRHASVFPNAYFCLFLPIRDKGRFALQQTEIFLIQRKFPHSAFRELAKYFQGERVSLKDLEIIHSGKPQSAFWINRYCFFFFFNFSFDIQQEFISPSSDRGWSLKFSIKDFQHVRPHLALLVSFLIHPSLPRCLLSLNTQAAGPYHVTDFLPLTSPRVLKEVSILSPNHFLTSENHQGREGASFITVTHAMNYGQTLWGFKGSVAHFCCQTALQSHTSSLAPSRQLWQDDGRRASVTAAGKLRDSKSFRRKWGLLSRLSLGEHNHLRRGRLPLKAQTACLHKPGPLWTVFSGTQPG